MCIINRFARRFSLQISVHFCRAPFYRPLSTICWPFVFKPTAKSRCKFTLPKISTRPPLPRLPPSLYLFLSLPFPSPTSHNILPLPKKIFIFPFSSSSFLSYHLCSFVSLLCSVSLFSLFPSSPSPLSSLLLLLFPLLSRSPYPSIHGRRNFKDTEPVMSAFL